MAEEKPGLPSFEAPSPAFDAPEAKGPFEGGKDVAAEKEEVLAELDRETAGFKEETAAQMEGFQERYDEPLDPEEATEGQELTREADESLEKFKKESEEIVEEEEKAEEEPAQEKSQEDDQEKRRKEEEEKERERREKLLEKARDKAESFLRRLDPDFSVSIKDVIVTPDDPKEAERATRCLRISHPKIREMNWTMDVGPDDAYVDEKLEPALQRVYDREIEVIGLTPEQLKLLETARETTEAFLKKQDPRFEVRADAMIVHGGQGGKPLYGARGLWIAHPSEPEMNWAMEVKLDRAAIEGDLPKKLERIHARKKTMGKEERAKAAGLAPGQVLHEDASEDEGQRKPLPEKEGETGPKEDW